MNTEYIRLECLKIAALGREGWPAKAIINEANKLFNFCLEGFKQAKELRK